MKLLRWLQWVCIGASLGCSTGNTVNVADNQGTREIVHATAVKSETDDTVVVVQSLPAGRYDGVLEDSGDCRRLISSDDLFETPALQKAYEDYQKSRYAKAAEGFKAAIEDTAISKGDRQKAYFLMAVAEQKLGDESGISCEDMKRAFEIDAPLRRTAAVYGTKYSYSAGRWQDIVDFTEDLKTSEEFRTYRAIAMTNLGQYDAAVAEFDGIREYPKTLRLDALQARARAQSETAQLKSSLETYRRIYELDPNSAQGQMAQDAIMAERDRWPAGFTFPRSAQKADTAKSDRDIALAHFNAHRSEKAIAAYSKLLKTDKNKRDTAHVCEDLYNIARSHVKLRSHTKSLPIFKEAMETCEKTDLHVKIIYSAAKAAWNAANRDLAIEWFQKIIDTYPSHSYADDAYFYQAQILTEQNKTDDARTKLQAQIKAYPDGDMAKDAYWMLLADLYLRELYREAVEFVDENLAHAGESDLYSQGRLQYFQGRAYEKLGNKQSAIQNYLNVLERYPLAYYAMLSMGRLSQIESSQSVVWMETYRTRVYQPSDGLNYCFQVIQNGSEFSAAQTLAKMGLYNDALDEIDPLVNSSQARVSYEAKLARAILLQKNGRYSESARLAASLLKPAQDLPQKGYAAWLLAYPKPWESLVSKAAPAESTLYYTAYAIMREESYYNPKAESWANARGLMQLMLPTAQSTAAQIGMDKPAAQDLFKPEIAIPIGTAYIDKLNKILVPHPMFVLPGYNAGQGNVGKWMTRFADLDVDMYVEKIPFTEARHYAKRVGTTLWRYRWLYDKQMPPVFDPAQNVGKLRE